jgi:microcystin-dependent protein
MSTPFLGQIETFSFNFAPKGWAQCNGQLLPINQNQPLFSLLGTTFGGDGRVNFALPDLRSRVPIHMGADFTLGQRGGEEAHTINTSEIPAHTHSLTGTSTDGTSTTPPGTLAKSVASANPGGTFTMSLYSTGQPNGLLWANTMGNAGGSQPHTNLMPYLCINMCIALQGIFPSQT